MDRVIVDAGRSFAAGQVYVALSRCRSLEGIVLHSLITPGALREDRRIDRFSASHQAADELRSDLEREKAEYAAHLLQRLFAFSRLLAHLDEWRDLITSTAKIPDKDQAVALHERIHRQAVELEQTAEKFRRQLQRLIEEAGGAPRCLPILKERCEKAIEYFTERIATGLAAPLRVYSDSCRSKKKLKRYLAHVSLFERICWEKIESLYDAKLLDRNLYAGARPYRRHGRKGVAETSPATAGNQAGHKEKGATLKETLDLHRGGKSPEEIAATRGLTVGTIKSHLARLIERGELDAHDVLPTTTIDAVISFLRDHVDANLTAIRTGTGDRFDYNDIRMAVAHWARTHASKQA